MILLAIVFSLTTAYAHGPGGGMMGRGYGMGPMGQSPQGGWYCPNCGSQMGPGMMGQGMMGPGMMGGGYGMGYGMMGRGMMGGGMMGQGMMGQGMMPHGQGMGPGMMGPGYGQQYGYSGTPGYQQPQRQMEEKDATEIVENYIRSTRNPNLKLGKIEEKGATFVAEILTKDDSLVDKIEVDKSTGWLRSTY